MWLLSKSRIIRNHEAGFRAPGDQSRKRTFTGRPIPDKLRKAIPHSDLIATLPKLPFIGELSYPNIVAILRSQRRWMTRPERIVVDQLVEYLEMKQATRPRGMVQEQNRSIFEEEAELPFAHSLAVVD
jgi:hypothetical protein